MPVDAARVALQIQRSLCFLTSIGNARVGAILLPSAEAEDLGGNARPWKSKDWLDRREASICESSGSRP